MLLHNRYFLYLIFFVALLDFLYLGYIEDIESVSVFILVGILTAFFNKNMIVVLLSAVIVTNILKYTGIEKVLTEGLDNPSDDEEDEDEDEDEAEETKENSKKGLKEDFGQDEKVVYTETDEADGEEKMVLAHEHLLEKMNKYKPLLDTLSGLTKNIATMKQIGHDAKILSDDNTDEYEKETADVKIKAPKKTNTTKKSEKKSMKEETE